MTLPYVSNLQMQIHFIHKYDYNALANMSHPMEIYLLTVTIP